MVEVELDELVLLKDVLLTELEVELTELLVLEKLVEVELIEVLLLVELIDVELVEVLEILLLVLEIDVLLDVLLWEVLLVDELVLLIELLVLLKDVLVLEVEVLWLVVLILLEVLLIELDVELVLKVLADVLEVDVVVPVGNRKKLAMPAAHWAELIPKVAACAPPPVTSWSSIAISIVARPLTDVRLTNPAPAVIEFDRVVVTAPINSSTF